MKKLFLLLLVQSTYALSYVHIATIHGNESGWDGFKTPIGLFVDSSDRLYVTDSGNHRVAVYDPDMAYLSSRGGTLGNGATDLNFPEGAWVGDDGKLYIADTFNHRVQIYRSYDGSFFKTLTQGTGVLYTMFRPGGVAVDANGNVHVADTFNNRIAIFTSAGIFLRQVSSPEPFGDYVFNNPSGIFIDSARDRIYVADTGNNRVQVFDSNYTFVGRLGWGEGELAFDAPRNVYSDSMGRIYVADTGHDRVQVFDQNLTFLASIKGAEGNASTNFTAPTGVAVDSRGRVYVADSVGNRVQVFQSIDVELEALYARNKIRAAQDAVNAVLQPIAAAQEMIDAIARSGCTDAEGPRAYLDAARMRLALANDSLSLADTLLLQGLYSNASAAADSAQLFAGEAAESANSSVRLSKQFLADAGEAVSEMGEVVDVFDEIGSLNATAEGLNITLQPVDALVAANQAYSQAVESCGIANYGDALYWAKQAKGNATLALDAFKQQVNIVLIPQYAQLRQEFEEVKRNITLYDAPIDITPVEVELSLANTLLLDSRYEEALTKMASVRSSLAAIRAALDDYAGESLARRAAISEEINAAKERLTALDALARNYSQQPGFDYASLLIRQAEENLSAGNLTAANSSIALAKAELDRLNSTLNASITAINDARAMIEDAKSEIKKAESLALPPLLRADTTGARSDVLSAEVVLYSDPEQAGMLARGAADKARAEQERLSSQRNTLAIIGVGLVVVLLTMALLATGALAGAFAFLRYLRRRMEGKLDKKGKKRGKPGGAS